MKKTLLLLLIPMILSACSSMSPEECRSANWQQIGYLDGQNGVNPTVISDYVKDCRDAGVYPDQEMWQRGFEQGREYYGVCNNERFLENYQKGYQDYLVQKRLNEINKEISDIDTQLRILKNDNENKQQRKTLESRRKELIRERTSLIVPTRSYNLKFSF
ncbi:DUF2799 domain-containing protein [Vibrio vulnificus]|nr:DUF2799 domain-containing protein [Vibrio vulnificus]EHZ2755347.1 DUF2799 domain-containing protein [Vibrio vulnificus]EHZ2764487.1 DUF2799 domain-containing protein [Vibrio vulnificus]EKD8804083.1 DUF2799 domain-containing protein [Vibrio vulnificus]EKD9322538.1 DUF2799 domain-containing protein [Vibrio vulnificus]